MSQAPNSATLVPRPPVVAVVGHIDHGKSTLLDYIRKSNVVAGEAGGITQHLSAYEASHNGKTITFLDTPGHEAFAAMRSRSLSAADIAILVVSAEDGVKPQTTEAYKFIESTATPFVVAITKIDKPDANIERAKNSLLESGIYLEGLGGNIPYVGVSGKAGTGIDELLDLILLQAELSELMYDPKAPARGIVIEAHADAKRGIAATLIVKDGTLRSGGFVVAGAAQAPMRIMENFLGKPIREVGAGQPVGIVGFSALPAVGSEFYTVENKKEAEAKVDEAVQAEKGKQPPADSTGAISEESEEAPPTVAAIVIKTDVAGSGEAVVHEIGKIPLIKNLEIRMLANSVGAISENDVRLAGSGETPGMVVGFNVKVESSAAALAERLGVAVATFTIIYKLTEWLQEELHNRRPRERVDEKIGSARVIKLFSSDKKSVVLGGRVEEGKMVQNAEVRIMRRDLNLGEGSIVSLQSQKKSVREVPEGSEFGAQIKTSASVAAGDHLEIIEVVYK